MIKIPIDLGDMILYVDWEEFIDNREWYEQIELEKTGRITTRDTPKGKG